MAVPEITVEELRQRFNYDPLTGVFTHKMGVKKNKNGTAGTRTPRGYIYLHIDHRRYLAHRLAWLYTYAILPDADKQIDHINGLRYDNKISNLRLVSIRENQQNRVEHRAGRLPGALPSGKRWRARLRINGQRVDLGSFATQEEAHEAYLKQLTKLEV